MLKKIGVPSIITGNPEEIRSAHKIILPGVGAFDVGVQKLKNADIWEVLNEKALTEKIPILGICLGAQLMTKGSEEGLLTGFSWVDADTVRFKIDRESKLKVPNMGWNYTHVCRESRLYKDLPTEPRFYFVHSYHFKFHNISQELTSTKYSYEFCSSFEKENILGVQFHPEKSHKFGMKLLKNFALNY